MLPLMRLSLPLLAAFALSSCAHAANETEPEAMSQPPPPVVRTPLLTAVLEGAPTVERVEVKRVELGPNLASGAHLHPCPVVGVVTEGSVYFQIDGEPARVLHPGDAFYEPANVRVLHFDAQGQGATFLANYLLQSPDQELIRMLE